MVLGALSVPTAFAAHFSVLCSSWTHELQSDENPSWLLLLSYFMAYYPCLSLTFAGPMFHPQRNLSSFSKGAKPLLRQIPALWQGSTGLHIASGESLLDSYPKEDKPKEMRPNHWKLPIVFKVISLWVSSIKYFFRKRDGPSKKSVLQIFNPKK